jgi:hypothetical protein
MATGVGVSAEYLSTLVHHIYGGLIYRTPERFAIALFFTVMLLPTIGLLLRYRRTRSPPVLIALGIVVAVVWVVVLGLFEGGYNHTYKDILFLAGVPRVQVLKLHPAAMAGDFTYPPDSLLFEASGVLQFLTSLFTVYFVCRLWRVRNAVGSTSPVGEAEPATRQP